jgi:hypothetical protein
MCVQESALDEDTTSYLAKTDWLACLETMYCLLA